MNCSFFLRECVWERGLYLLPNTHTHTQSENWIICQSHTESIMKKLSIRAIELDKLCLVLFISSSLWIKVTESVERSTFTCLWTTVASFEINSLLCILNSKSISTLNLSLFFFLWAISAVVFYDSVWYFYKGFCSEWGTNKILNLNLLKPAVCVLHFKTLSLIYLWTSRKLCCCFRWFERLRYLSYLTAAANV